MSGDVRDPAASLLRTPYVILFAVTLGVFLWMALVTSPAFERETGAKMLDGRVLGYTPADVVDLHLRVKANPEAAVIANRMHRTLDFAFPALLTLSITLIAATGIAKLGRLRGRPPGRVSRLFAGALAIPYLGFDLRENGLSQNLFSADSLAGDPPPAIVAALPDATMWKYTTLGLAIVLTALIWALVFAYSRDQET